MESRKGDSSAINISKLYLCPKTTSSLTRDCHQPHLCNKCSDVLNSEECQTKSFSFSKCLLFSKPFTSFVPQKDCFQ